jgi:uncharacterized membrane protein
MVVLALCGCSSSGGGGDTPGTDGGEIALDAGADAKLPADVDAVLASRCRKCHSDPPQHDAPFPLLTWANTHERYANDGNKPIYQLMGVRIHDESFPMPPEGNPMTDADRAVLDKWIAKGAPSAP